MSAQKLNEAINVVKAVPHTATAEDTYEALKKYTLDPTDAPAKARSTRLLAVTKSAAPGAGAARTKKTPS